ncbi:hypothetical protein FRC17_008567, partial [Serendipita sp. 399]
DFGPFATPINGLDTLFISNIPLIVAAYVAVLYYNRACYNFWHAGHSSFSSEASSHHQRQIPNTQRNKYIYFCISSICALIYGVIWYCLAYVTNVLWPDEGKDRWWTYIALMANRDIYKQVHLFTRQVLHEYDPEIARNLTGFAFTLPIAAFHFCFCFGLGTELHKVYAQWQPQWKMPNLHSRWWRQRPQVDPNDYTPFVMDDLLMEDLPIITAQAITPFPLASSPPPFPVLPPPVYRLGKLRDIYSSPIPLAPVAMHKSLRGEDRHDEEGADRTHNTQPLVRSARKGCSPPAEVAVPVHRKHGHDRGLYQPPSRRIVPSILPQHKPRLPNFTDS